MVALALFLLQQAPPSVSLNHVFEKGTRASFEVRSTLHTESKDRGITTWFPDSAEFRYTFSLDVQDVGAQGVAKIRYRRPNIVKTFAEQFDRPERTEVEKVDDDVMLQISPANEILDASDIKHPKPPEKANSEIRSWVGSDATSTAAPLNILKIFYSLALFTGSLESSIDFNPRLPFDKVKPGDTWKRTATYAPQKLKGGQDLAVQRLDYTFTYVGVVQSEGKSVDRVTAKLRLETDAAAYLHQVTNMTPAQTRLRSLPVLLDASMEFDLSRANHKTLRASASSKGSFKVFSTDVLDEPVYEERLTGETTLEPIPNSAQPGAKKTG